MMEWKVAGHEPLPEEEPPAPRPAPPWFQLGLLLIVLLLALGLWRFGQRQAARLEAELTHFMLIEERALRLGDPLQARELLDPRSPASWQLRYQRLFTLPAGQSWPPPTLAQIEWSGEIAIVTVGYEQAGERWQQQRAYRLHAGQWRRTTLPTEAWGLARAHRSPHFTLWMSPRDAAALPPVELLRGLEEFYVQFALLWPVQAYDLPLELHLLPQDLAPVPASPLADFPLALNSPLIASYMLPDPTQPLPLLYRYEVALEVAAALDGAHQLRGQSQEELLLRQALREALVRHLVLPAEARHTFRAQGPEGRGPSAITLDARTMRYLLDYLLISEGPVAAAQLLEARTKTHSFGEALFYAFQRPLGYFLAEISLWQEASRTDQPSPEGGRVEATLLRLTHVEPLEAIILPDGALEPQRLESVERVAFPLPLPCVGRGSRLSFEPLPTNPVRGQTLRLLEVRLPAPAWDPTIPLHGNLLIALPQGGTLHLALTDRQGTQRPLFSLPPESGLQSDGYHRFAFFEEDRCGPSITQFDAERPTLTRAPVNLTGQGHLFWSGTRLFLLDDASQGDPARWILHPVAPWQVEAGRAIPMAQALSEVLGYDPPHERYLVRLGDGTLRWLDLASLTVTAPPFALPPDAYPLSLAPSGRWLAYRQQRALYLLDLHDGTRQQRYRAPAEHEIETVLWWPSEEPWLLMLLSAPLDGQRVAHLLQLPPSSSDPDGQQYDLGGPIEQPHLCQDGALYLRLQRDGVWRVVNGLLSYPHEVAIDAQIMGCLWLP